MVRFFEVSLGGGLDSSETAGQRGGGLRVKLRRGRCSRHADASSGAMSGWLSCCDCLQRRAMAPARQPGAPQASQEPRGHCNAAFLEDEQDERPQLLPLDEDGSVQPTPSPPPPPLPPPAERPRAAPQLARSQFRQVVDLRGDQPRLVGRPVPVSSSQPFEPLACGWDPEEASPDTQQAPHSESKTPAAGQLQGRRASQLEDVPETAEGGGERADDGGQRRGSEVAPTSPSLPTNRQEDVDEVRPHTPGPVGPTEVTSPLSPNSAKRLHFPKFRRRSSQTRRQRRAAGAAAGAAAGHESTKERGWLQRLSRVTRDTKPPGASTEDPPPSQPPPPRRSIAARRWGIVRETFDLDAPLSDHWKFLETLISDFEKIDAKTYTEHLHEQSPLSSSSSDEEVPDPLEAQLMLKLSQAENIRQRKSPVSRRCLANERRNRRMQRQNSKSDDEKSNPAEVPAAEDQKCDEISGSPPTEPGPEAQTNAVIEPSAVRPSSGLHRRAAGGPPSACTASTLLEKQRASSCPPTEGATEPPPAAAATRRRRGSIFDRLFSTPDSQWRRSSLPAASAPVEAAEPGSPVHHPTWFQRAGEQVGVPSEGTDKLALARRRQSAVEDSLTEFLGQVDERARELREEEFRGSDPYEVMAPEQIAADDDHVVPMVNSQRCVRLMLEDAERHLQHEYESAPSPSPRPSPCHTPRRWQVAQRDGGPGGRQAADVPGGSAGYSGAIAGGSGSSPRDCRTADHPHHPGEGTVDNAEEGPRNNQPAGRSRDGQSASTSHRPGAGTSGMSETGSRDKESAHTSEPSPRGRPISAGRRRSHAEKAAPGKPCRDQASSPIVIPQSSALPARLANLQSEVTSVAEALKSKLQAVLSAGQDAEPAPSVSRSKPLQKTSKKMKSSRSRSLTSDALPSASAHPSAGASMAASSSAPPTSRTPRNSLLQQGPPPLAGYQQLALALAEQSAAGRQPPAVADSCPVIGQSSPGAATSACARPRRTSLADESWSHAIQSSSEARSPAAGVCAPPPSASGAPQEPSSSPSAPSAHPPGCPTSLLRSSATDPQATCSPSDDTGFRKSAGGCTWTIPLPGRTGSSPPPGLLAGRRPCGVSRDLSPPAVAALRLRLEGRQRAAAQRRHTHLWRRAARAAAMSAPPHGRPVSS